MRYYSTRLNRIEKEIGLNGKKEYMILRDPSGSIARLRKDYPLSGGIPGYKDETGQAIMIWERQGKQLNRGIDPVSEQGQEILRRN